MKAMIFDIQECTFHDGPGGRMTIFMKGCPLRCRWCHNPEGQNIKQETMYKKNKCIQCNSCENKQKIEKCPTQALSIVGKEITSDELIQEVLKLKETLQMMEGGVTFSGGEPTYQPQFLLECLKKLKENNIHTCIETCGDCDSNLFTQIIEQCDIVIMDIKIMNEQNHIKYTGKSNKTILKNAKILMKHPNYLFRTPLIKNITDTKDNLDKIKSFIKDSPWEKIPSNELAYLKYEQLNREYQL